MLKNDALVAKIGVDTAENEPRNLEKFQICQNFEKFVKFFLPSTLVQPSVAVESRRDRRGADRAAPARVKARALMAHRSMECHETSLFSEARSRLDRRRSLQVNSYFSAFFKIYKIFRILRRSNLKIFEKFVKNFAISKKFQILRKILNLQNQLN